MFINISEGISYFTYVHKKLEFNLLVMYFLILRKNRRVLRRISGARTLGTDESRKCTMGPGANLTFKKYFVYKHVKMFRCDEHLKWIE